MNLAEAFAWVSDQGLKGLQGSQHIWENKPPRRTIYEKVTGRTSVRKLVGPCWSGTPHARVRNWASSEMEVRFFLPDARLRLNGEAGAAMAKIFLLCWNTQTAGTQIPGVVFWPVWRPCSQKPWEGQGSCEGCSKAILLMSLFRSCAPDRRLPVAERLAR